MTVSTFSVSDMHCAVCAGRIRRALAPLVGIRATHINPVRRQVLVDHGADTDPLQILLTIETAGFSPTLTGLDDHDARQRTLLKRLGVAGFAMMQVMMAAIALYAGAFTGMDAPYERLLQYTSLVFTIPVVCYSAMPFFTGAVTSLTSRGGPGMDVPIALAILIAFLVSLHATITGAGEVYYDSVVMFTFLLLGARYIDNRAQRSFDLTGQLLAALPRQALREIDGTREPVDVALLEAGDRVWVDEGTQVPVDGVLQSGPAELDEAVLTGESDWVYRHPGDPVYAGTLNRGAGFSLLATHAFDRSRMADIAALAERAEVGNARITRLADRVARVFVPAVLILSAAAFVGWQLVDPDRALVAALTVLVVSCPCALSLATPAALTAAMTRLRQLGIVLTSSQTLERAAGVDRVFIDKTGTLTVDEPVIEAVDVLAAELEEAACLKIAAGLQRHSNHPYARAFHHLPARSTVTAVSTVTGQGVQGTLDGTTVRIGRAGFAGADDHDDRAVYLSIDGAPVARFWLSNRVRPDAREAVRRLERLGALPEMLSGDATERCEALARELGMPFRARQAPEDKLAAIREAQAQGHRVLMLGDGINDVPVLAGADVSAAVLEASDLVKSRADVLLLGRRLAPLADLFHVASATRRVIRQNLFWALTYNTIAVPIAALGYMPPWLAALGMAASSTGVMLNATRLLKFSPGTAGVDLEA